MNIQALLEQKIADFKSLELAKNHLEKIHLRLKNNQIKLVALQTILEKEYKDVKTLEALSMRALFEKILGNKQAQLEIERQEYLTAALNYNECHKSQELLVFECELLQKKLKNYNTTKSELHSLIRKRESSIVNEDPLARQLIEAFNKKIDYEIAYKKEVHEAISIGLKLKKQFNTIINDFEQIKSWGVYTLGSPDLQIRQNAHINQIRDKIYIAKQWLQEFEDEISDIYDREDVYIQSTLNMFRLFIDSFFDNLISDWLVSAKIKNSLFTIQQVNDKVIRITQSLKYDLKQSEKKLQDLKKKKEKIIIELN